MAQSRHKQPTVGLRVEKGLQEAFATLAREKFKITPSKLLTAIFEAAVNGKSTGQDLTIRIRLTAGATKDEVESIIRREIAAALSIPRNNEAKATETSDMLDAAYAETQPEISEGERIAGEEFDAAWKKAYVSEKSRLIVPPELTGKDEYRAAMKAAAEELRMSSSWNNSAGSQEIFGHDDDAETLVAFGKLYREKWIAIRCEA